jgi:hypothetical protein
MGKTLLARDRNGRIMERKKIFVKRRGLGRIMQSSVSQPVGCVPLVRSDGRLGGTPRLIENKSLINHKHDIIMPINVKMHLLETIKVLYLPWLV